MPNQTINVPVYAIAERIARSLRHNAEAYHAGTMTHDEFGTSNRALWREAEAFQAAPIVRDVLLLNGWI